MNEKPATRRTASRTGEPSPGNVPAGTSRAHLEAILETAVEGIVVIDMHGMIEVFNHAAEKMFGYAAAEVIGKNVSILMPEPFRGEHDRYIENYLETGRAKIIGIGRETVAMRKDGTTFPVELAVSEVRVGDRIAFTGLIKDITEQKRLEQEILDVSEREQRRIAQDLHDGVCQELAGIAFKVQTMKTAKQGGDAIAPADLGEIITLLQNAMRRARRLSQGLNPVDPSPNGLRIALGQLAASLSDAMGVSCECRCEQPVEVFNPAAATHLYRIAQEAARDAVRHGHARHIVIELSAREHVVTLTVSDDGTALSKDGRFDADMSMALMVHRAHLMGANLKIKPNGRRGVRVLCELPQRQAT